MGSQRPSHPKSRREGLGEGPEIDDAFIGHRAHGGRRITVETEQAVGVVLEHQDAVTLADLQDLWSSLQGQRGASRVVEVRDGVEELDALAGGQQLTDCLLYTSPSPRDGLLSRMPS